METLSVVGQLGPERPGKFGFMGCEQLVLLALNKGYSLECKPGHRVWASSEGLWAWRHAEDLTEGDTVQLRGGDNLWANAAPLSPQTIADAAKGVTAGSAGVPLSIRTACRRDVEHFLYLVFFEGSPVTCGHEQTAMDLQVMLLNAGRTSTRLGSVVTEVQPLAGNLLELTVVRICPTKVADTYDINMPATSTVVTNGIVSHNSDVRLRQTSRSLSGPKAYFSPKPGKKGGEATFNEIERSVEFPGTKDEYRYVHVKAIKNKLWTPDRVGWIRIWKEDGNGVARGIDPFFDVMAYLKDTGQVKGQRAALKLNLEGLGPAKVSLTWEECKLWVLGDKEAMTKVSTKAGYKPMNLRAFCFKQMKSGVAEDLYVKVKAAKDANGSSDDDDSSAD